MRLFILLNLLTAFLTCATNKYVPVEKIITRKIQSNLNESTKVPWIVAGEVHSRFIQEHIVLMVEDLSLPSSICYVAVGPDSTVHLLWKMEEFNKMINEEKLHLSTREDVMALLKLFFAWSYNGPRLFPKGDSSMVLIVTNTNDIPIIKGLGLKNPLSKTGLAFYMAELEKESNTLPSDSVWKKEMFLKLKALMDYPESQLEKVIKPPAIAKENQTFIVDLYTWERWFGLIKVWKIQVDSPGTITIISKTDITIGIGIYFEYVM